MTTWDEWSYEECCSKCIEWGGQTTITAFERHRSKAKDLIGNGRIRFEWHDANQPSSRAQCIRGAFKRIGRGRDNGKCSKNFEATFRVVRGLSDTGAERSMPSR